MALYVTRPRRDEERIGRGLPSGVMRYESAEAKSWCNATGSRLDDFVIFKNTALRLKYAMWLVEIMQIQSSNKVHEHDQ